MEGEENKDPLVRTVLPTLSLVMEQGTAKQVGTGGHDDSYQVPCVSIIDQAEGKPVTNGELLFSKMHSSYTVTHFFGNILNELANCKLGMIWSP